MFRLNANGCHVHFYVNLWLIVENSRVRRYIFSSKHLFGNTITINCKTIAYTCMRQFLLSLYGGYSPPKLTIASCSLISAFCIQATRFAFYHLRFRLFFHVCLCVKNTFCISSFTFHSLHTAFFVTQNTKFAR